MQKNLELWHFIAERLALGENVVLLVVAESSGSSPGRPGYKMAVGADGELIGSIGGGLMEINLVEESRRLLSVPPAIAGGSWEQVHRENAPHASGMICSGRQTVLFKVLTPSDADTVATILGVDEPVGLELTPTSFVAKANPPAIAGGTDFHVTGSSFRYSEILGASNHLYIIGGGHCALALSELMSKLDFHISLFDDRPELNTIAKNRFAHSIRIIDSYDTIAGEVPDGPSSYVVVMTLGYVSDEQAIRSLLAKQFKYFGVLGSSAKMSIMLRKLIKEGLPAEKLDRIRTPIGVRINSRTPEEIAISIAAEIISVKNG